ncbi:uncharacterized protein LOC120400862 [Mauremys reevesii]|uniref:uncharacterized protein LOC120400862 n=1 Tax=Mauremys reevesii TaxID=260615 RepID=UPI00193FA872|nr:uncharacterized protein LOC120400862 [Mauremys reevesii]
MPDVLFLSRPLAGFHSGRFPDTVDVSPAIRFSTVPTRPQGPAENMQRQSPLDHDRSSVAQVALVYHVARPVNSRPYPTTSSPGPDNSGSWQTASPRPTIPPSHGMAPEWLTQSELRYSVPVQQVLLGSRKPSTRATYLAKWKRFTCWCGEHNVLPAEVSIPTILDYYWSLKQQGLAVPSLRVHLAAISTFHPGENGRLVFSHPVVSRFLKGMERLYPQVRCPAPTWDLNLVLTRLMSAPFEPLATCSLLYLSWKTAFLVAITSARRVSKLWALTVDPPYTVFHKDKVQL